MEIEYYPRLQKIIRWIGIIDYISITALVVFLILINGISLESGTSIPLIIFGIAILLPFIFCYFSLKSFQKQHLRIGLVLLVIFIGISLLVQYYTIPFILVNWQYYLDPSMGIL